MQYAEPMQTGIQIAAGVTAPEIREIELKKARRQPPLLGEINLEARRSDYQSNGHSVFLTQTSAS